MHGGLGRNRKAAASVLVFLAVFAQGLLRTADAATVTLQWDSNRESDLGGYFVDYGTQSGQLTTTVDVGNHTVYQVADLEIGRTYYFAVRAYNTGGLSSAPSPEVSATIGTASLSLTNLTANLPPPRKAGTAVILAAAASGGVPPYQYKWFISDGSRSTMARDWSPDNTFTWQPQLPNPNYAVSAWARSATNSADAAESSSAQRTLSFAITAADPTVINLTADKEAPQRPGTRITFAATATGGTYEFQWSVFNGVTWTVVQEWSSNRSYAWTPSAANSRYQVMVRVRGGQSLGANAGIALPFPVQ